MTGRTAYKLLKKTDIVMGDFNCVPDTAHDKYADDESTYPKQASVQTLRTPCMVRMHCRYSLSLSLSVFDGVQQPLVVRRA